MAQPTPHATRATASVALHAFSSMRFAHPAFLDASVMQFQYRAATMTNPAAILSILRCYGQLGHPVESLTVELHDQIQKLARPAAQGHASQQQQERPQQQQQQQQQQQGRRRQQQQQPQEHKKQLQRLRPQDEMQGQHI
ncbi:MAG: hypothetical protein WDW36_006515 [Sanguina aurantia]